MAERIGAASRAWGRVSALHTTQPIASSATWWSPPRCFALTETRGRSRVTSRRPGERTAPRLRGRRAESAALDRVVEAVLSGRSSVLVVRGEPGVGKSVLLDHLVDRASGCRVARAARRRVGDGAAAGRAATARGASMLERVDRLPAPQQEALRLAFGLSEGPAPDRFLLGLAALSLLSDAAHRAAARVRDRRRAVARPRIRPGAVVRRASPRGRAGRDGVRGSRAVRRAGARRAAGARGRGAGRRGRTRAPRVGRSQGVWTNRFATASWPRPGAIRSRSSSCRAD